MIFQSLISKTEFVVTGAVLLLILTPAVGDMVSPLEEGPGEVAHLAAGHRVNALVADDVKENRDVLSRVLSDIGVSVVMVEDGQQAVEAVRTHSLDIVFMDIRMPVMGGLEAARHVLEQFGESRPKLVAISSSVLTHEQQRFLDAGFDRFIPKPFRSEQVYETLAALLGVGYDYADREAPERSEMDLSKITLSEDLLRRMQEAAEISSVTELTSYLDEVASSGEEGGRLAEHLRELILEYNMEAILTILRESAEQGDDNLLDVR